MQPFKITEPSSIDAAINMLATNPRAKLIGGGTNLVDLMKMYVELPDQLIDINSLALNRVEVLPGGQVSIGALVRNSDLAYHATIREKFPVLSQALLSGASGQLRNMATVGGNLMQRTRCPYFFNPSFPCNKRVPGSGCSAIKGYNRSHAILGTSEYCIATHPSDMCVALSALGAIVQVQGKAGSRSIPITEFYRQPGDAPHLETALAHDELIVAVEIPPLPHAARSAYLKVRDRASFEFALTSAAVVLEVTGGTIASARVALGGVGTVPWRSAAAEASLTGAKNSRRSYEEAAAIALEGAKTFRHNSFKPALAKRTLVRALENTGGVS